MNEYLIKIKGKQGLDGQTELIEFSTFGDMVFSDGTVTLSYNEGEMMGAKSVKTRLSVTGGESAVIERKGDVNSRLVIEKNKRNDCFYSTPIGDIVIGIFGEKIENGLTERGGKLKLSYTLDSNLVPVSKNIVDIEVRKAK